MERAAVVLMLWLAVAASAHAAGGHYAVDDAVIVAPGRCQIEAWFTTTTRDHDELHVLPACNPTGNVELTLGVVHEDQAGSRRVLIEPAVKTLFRDLESEDWGWGLAAAVLYDTSAGRVDGATTYVPLSVLLHDTVLAHYKAGIGYDRAARETEILWGIGSEVELAFDFSVVAEIFGTHRGGTTFQGGLRRAIGPGLLDLSYGRTRRGDDWFTIGIAWNL